MKRLLKGLAWLIGGGVALLVACYLALLVINLRDQPPSEFALRLEEIHRNRPVVADVDNGYIQLMNFPAATSSPPAQQIFAACAWDSSRCDSVLAANDQTFPDWFITEQPRVDNYLGLLKLPGWLEPIPADLATPMPAYSPVLEAQKLLLAQAYHRAAQQDANGVREILEQDMRFWRRLLAESDILISRMIAVAALTRHLNMGNLAIRRLPPQLQLAAMPEAWRAPLTAQELSWHRCFAGEWAYGRNIWQQILKEDELPAAVGLEDRFFIQTLENLLTKPLFQLQDTHNQSAEIFVRAADALQVPIERFIEGRDAAEKVFAAPAEKIFTLANLYNPIGDMLSGMSSSNYGVYPPRVADLEGARRAAVLVTELRSRKLDTAGIQTQIEASNLRVPYSGEPFAWDDGTQSIVFIGLVPKERGRHSFKY